jgi:hypothetical protein
MRFYKRVLSIVFAAFLLIISNQNITAAQSLSKARNIIDPQEEPPQIPRLVTERDTNLIKLYNEAAGKIQRLMDEREEGIQANGSPKRRYSPEAANAELRAVSDVDIKVIQQEYQKQFIAMRALYARKIRMMQNDLHLPENDLEDPKLIRRLKRLP